MQEQNRPGVIRLLLYMILSASLVGSMAGWINASGAFDWAATLNMPTWTAPRTILTAVWIVLFQLLAISLWISQRSERAGLRLISSILLLGLIGVITFRMCIIFSVRDLPLSFAISLAAWVYALIAVGIVGRNSQAAGFLLWPMFGWMTYGLALSFELMRLNTGSIMAGGL